MRGCHIVFAAAWSRQAMLLHFLGPVVCCDVVRQTPASVVSGHIFLEFSVFQNYIDVLRHYDDVDT